MWTSAVPVRGSVRGTAARDVYILERNSLDGAFSY